MKRWDLVEPNHSLSSEIDTPIEPRNQTVDTQDTQRCCICLEDIMTISPELGTDTPFECRHGFHDVCFRQMYLHAQYEEYDLKCPLCTECLRPSSEVYQLMRETFGDLEPYDAQGYVEEDEEGTHTPRAYLRSLVNRYSKFLLCIGTISVLCVPFMHDVR